MSTIVCQNIISCFESHMETTATLKLKVASAAAAPPAAVDFFKKIVTEDHPPPFEVKKTNLDNFGNWGFLQTNIPKETGDKIEINSYTHPLAKKSSFSRLSPKSLELCTENLGSETGTDIITDSSSIFSSPSTSPPLSPSRGNSTSTHKKDISEQETILFKNPYQKESNSSRKAKSFPPPLTTMSGSSSLQVRRHIEGGRLIIEAVEAPFRNSYLQAERSDGRLRLCFLTAEPAAAHGGEQEDDEEEEVDECGGEMAAEAEEEEEIEEPIIIDEVESEKEELDGEINLEMEMEKIQRFRRCNEGEHGNRGFCTSNWKPALWVATS